MIIQNQSAQDGDPKAIFDSIVEKARQMDTPAAKEFVAKVDAGEITAQSIANELGVFKDGRVALYPDEHKYLVKAYFSEHFGEWAKKTFGITNESGFDAVLRGLKGAQSLVLLDFSPSYLVNNFINNRVLMAMNGVFGFTTNEKMDGWFNEFGFTPEGAGEGFGAAQYEPGRNPGAVNEDGGGSLGVTSTPKDLAGVSLSSKKNLPKDGNTIIREGTKNTGLAGRIADRISGLRKFGIFSRMSAGLEGSSGKQMFYAAMRSYYGHRWKAGEGFRKMPELLRNRLAERGFDPDLIERTIEGFVSSKELDGLVNGSNNRNVSVLVHSAAEALGIDAGEAATMLGQLGILDELKEGLAKATTDEDIRAVFRQAREKGEKSVAERWQKELLDKAKHAQQKTQSEGLAGAVDAFDSLEDLYFQTKVENDLSWDETFERLKEEANNRDLRSVIIETTNSRASRRWQQAQDNYVATMGGIFAGINMDGPEVGRMLWIMGEKFRLYREFFAERDAAYAAFFHDTGDVRMTYAELERTINERWQRLVTGEIDPLMAELDDLFVAAFGKRFGEEGGYLARSWRDDIRRVDAELLQMMVEHRAGLANVDFETKATRWKEFKPKYQAKWQERLRNRNTGFGMLYERSGLADVEGRNNGSPSSVPSEPGTPPTSQDPGVYPPHAAGTMSGDELPQTKPVENIASNPESVNKRADEVSAAVERGRTATLSRERHKTAIFGMANQYGIATANPDGTPRVEAVDEIMAIVHEYGGPNSPQWKRFDDVPLDVVERAFDSWHNSPIDAVGGIESPDAVLRRVLGEDGGKGWDNLDSMREDIRSRLSDIEKYGTGLPARDAFRQQMLDMGMDADVVDATMALADAHAEVWGRGHGRDAGDWYEQRIAGIERGGVDPNGNRGMVERLEDGRSVITMFQGGDATTVLHELGHVFRLDLEGEDLKIIEDWAGVENGKWDVNAEEKFTKGLEQYVATRKAPTPELAGVFERFRNWVVEVYNRLRGRLDMEIPEEVMAVYDKMFMDDTKYEVKGRQEYKDNVRVDLGEPQGDRPGWKSGEDGYRYARLNMEVEVDGMQVEAWARIPTDGNGKFALVEVDEGKIDTATPDALLSRDPATLNEQEAKMAGLIEERKQLSNRKESAGAAYEAARKKVVADVEAGIVVDPTKADSGYYVANDGLMYEVYNGKIYSINEFGTRLETITRSALKDRKVKTFTPADEAARLKFDYEKLLSNRMNVDRKIGRLVDADPSLSQYDPTILGPRDNVIRTKNVIGEYGSLDEVINNFVDTSLKDNGIDLADPGTMSRMDPRSLSNEQHELIETAGLIKEVDDRMAVVDEAWQKAQDGINQSEGVSPRSAGDGHYLGNGMLYEKAGGKFYELMGDGSRGAEVSTKELAARGVEKVVPIGDSYRLQVEYQQLAAQRAELLVPRGFPLVTRRSS